MNKGNKCVKVMQDHRFMFHKVKLCIASGVVIKKNIIYKNRGKKCKRMSNIRILKCKRKVVFISLDNEKARHMDFFKAHALQIDY